jgi:KaiC/GvpD/RAD55 family RecA-like ATPase
MFQSASDNSFPERAARENTTKNMLRFGVEFLDDALRGIFPDDLVLLGAPSGMGKTQLCCNIAYANIADGRRVHYIALEASQFEIERRLKFPLVFERYMADPNRPRLHKRLNYPDWLMGAFTQELREYEESAAEFFEAAFKNLHVYYKHENFGVKELVKSVLIASGHTDLIIIDHVHYFDFDDDNENRAIREIAKTVRTLALEQQIPIILVAHLRKRDKQNEDMCAGLEEFHGSSDLYKIATKVITIAPGGPDQSGNFRTFFRIPKNRIDGGVTRYLGLEFFNPKKGGYEFGKYQVGWADLKKKEGFGTVDPAYRPDWARTEGTLVPLRRDSGRVSRAPGLADD